MYDNIIYQNLFISVAIEEKKVYLLNKKAGYNINDFKKVNDEYPRIRVTQFISFKSAITNAMNSFIEIGEYKEIIDITVSKDRFQAYATLYLSAKEFESINRDELIDLTIQNAEKKGIQYGIDVITIMENISVGNTFVIANGQKPTPGDDAIIKLYEINEAKPEIVENGSVNHYELNLINKVIEGDWLGERIEPTEGTPGRSVFGEIVKPQPGKQEKLIYDRKTIKSTTDEEKGVTTLTAKRVGAVVYENGILSVCNYLEITGKVSFETGNIDFDGYVDIKQSVEDNFSVVADNDIQIMGALGVGAVDSIESRGGDIYIRGGIAGQDKAEIICQGDLFTKFASDCTIRSNGTVHIGYYAMNANITAKEVVLESMNSRIIGGTINADIRVCAGEIGSRAETKTVIRIQGFDREAMREEYDELSVTIDKLKQMGQLLKQKIAIYQNSNTEEIDKKESMNLSKMETEYERCQKSLKVYIQKKKNYKGYLRTKGEGEVKAIKFMHPNVHISMGHDEIVNMKDHKIGITHYLKENQIVTDA